MLIKKLKLWQSSLRKNGTSCSSERRHDVYCFHRKVKSVRRQINDKITVLDIKTPFCIAYLYSFIHSKNYIALFKVTTQRRSQLKCKQKGRFANDLEMYRYPGLGNRRSSWGRSFQTLGSATENSRFCIDVVRANGTTRTSLSAERRDQLPWAPDTGRQRSIR